MVNRTIRVDASNTTQIRTITVGTPVRRVVQSSTNINNLQGVDISNLSNGSVLVYNTSSSNWESTTTLENQNISGGQY
jgi:hypothetical protein